MKKLISRGARDAGAHTVDRPTPEPKAVLTMLAAAGIFGPIVFTIGFVAQVLYRPTYNPIIPRIAQRDCRRAKPELMSESWSELDVPPVREGRNSEMESKKGRREKELSNSQEKKP